MSDSNLLKYENKYTTPHYYELLSVVLLGSILTKLFSVQSLRCAFSVK